MKRGRRPGDAGTREAIVAQHRDARALLLRYEGGPVRGRHDVAVPPAEILEPLLEEGLEGLGERLVRRLLGIWVTPESREPLVAMVRSATGHDAAAAMMRGFVEREIVGRIARAARA